MTIKKIPVKLGFCPICDKRFIDENGKPLPNHREITIKLSSGSLTKIGVCQDCIDKLTRDRIDQIYEGIKEWKIKYNELHSYASEKKKKEYKEAISKLKVTKRIGG